MAQRFDAIVIGTGRSRPSLAVRLGMSGRKTAVIERAAFGGTCVNVGCTPTKAHVARARAAHVVQHPVDFGVQVGGAVRESGQPALISIMPMSRVGRARERGETDGLMKALVDTQTKRILGGIDLRHRG